MAPTLKIFFHDRCFDGAATAALFADFYRQTQAKDVEIQFVGMAHSSGDPFAGVAIDGDDNACVDFRYCADPRMHWWFDHHISGFQPPSLRASFDADTTGKKFYDPRARSCALFVRSQLLRHFGYAPDDEQGHWKELLDWADTIDGALFKSAAEVVELEAPALRLMTWLKSNRDPELMTRVIESMGHRSLAELVDQEWIASAVDSLIEAQHRTTARIAEIVETRGRVAVYDLSEERVESHNGFAVYMLRPEVLYSVSLVVGVGVANISVGSNPWTDTRGGHNIAHICERYGGGGHPHVGGIAVPAEPIARAREIVEEVVEELNR